MSLFTRPPSFVADDPYDNNKAAFSSMRIRSKEEQTYLCELALDKANSNQPETLSMESLKANLIYTAMKKDEARTQFEDALISYHLALDALNQAIKKKNFGS